MSAPTRRPADTSGHARAQAGSAERLVSRLELPGWLRVVGTGSWFVLGVAGVLAIVLCVLGLLTDLMIPFVIAAVLAMIFVPLVDMLERLRVPRWLGAVTVVVVALGLVVGVVLIVVSGIAHQAGSIGDKASAAVNAGQSAVKDLGLDSDQLAQATREGLSVLVNGVLPQALGSVVSFVVGFVLGTFMLLFLLKDWRPIVGWAQVHIAPAPIGPQIIADTVQTFRGYALGLTVLGAANAVVVGIGGLVLGVPLVLSIVVVTFVTSYVPYFGAFFAGAFAVIVALGANGLPTALGILGVVLLANNTLQNLLEPFALGQTLRLHPLVVLIVTTAGTLLFGIFGGILAAPVTGIGRHLASQIRESGILTESALTPASAEAAHKTPAARATPRPKLRRRVT